MSSSTTDPESNGGLILAVSWPLASIATVLTVLRFYTNIKITRRLKADTYIASVTFVLCIIAQVFATLSVKYGIGSHIGTLSDDNIALALKNLWICQITFIVCMALGKLAIIAFLLQIRGPHDPRPWFLYTIGLSNILVNGITIVFILLQCDPLDRLFDERIPGTCNGRNRNQTFAFFQGSWSSFSDMALAAYPVYICWKLKVQLHVKVGLCVLLGLGLIASICSAVKTSELQTLSHTNDITFSLSPLLIWTIIETWIILIVGCVPPIRPLFLRIFHRVHDKMTTNVNGNSSSRIRSYHRVKFSKQGKSLHSSKSLSIDLSQGSSNGFGGSGVRNQVYMGDEVPGVMMPVGNGGGGGVVLGAGAGATGGPRESITPARWPHFEKDQVVVTTKIDVKYGDAESSTGDLEEDTVPLDTWRRGSNAGYNMPPAAPQRIGEAPGRTFYKERGRDSF